MIPGQKVEESAALEVLDETQDYERTQAAVELPFAVGDIVVASSLYISVCRGNMRDKVKSARWEVIGVTPRSVTCRDEGSDKKYGCQFPHRYVRKAA